MTAPAASFTAQEAARLDESDPLRKFRDEFVIEDTDTVYLDGNSLGRLPKRAVAAVRRTLEEEWPVDLVRGWERWADLGLRLGDDLAPLIGAGDGEVALCDQTGVNLYKLAWAAFDTVGGNDVVTDAGNFPSDRYILESVAKSRGGNLRVVGEDPEPAEVAAAVDSGVGLVALSHVSYRSGAILDMAAITTIAHEAGALALWDLAHSAGAIPVDLAGCGVGMAVGCTYKYLNGGPGSPGYLYVAKDIQQQLRQPITGWFGHADQFAFASQYVPAPDLRRFLVGTPSILSMVAAGPGIALTAEAGIAPIREKAMALTERFAAAAGVAGFEVASPLQPERRGSHVTIRHDAGWGIAQALRGRGVIVDFRAPDLVRFGFSSLYNSFDEARRAATALADVVAEGEHLTQSIERGRIT